MSTKTNIKTIKNLMASENKTSVKRDSILKLRGEKEIQL